MAQFRVRYHFHKDDFLEETIEASDITAAEHYVYHKADPGYTDQAPLADIEKGSALCLFAKAAVQYIWIEPAAQQDGRS